MNEFVIGEVLNLITNERDTEYAYRIGRTCFANEDAIKECNRIALDYGNGRALFLTRISSVEKTDKYIWITTKNRKYRLDRVL